MDLDTFIQRMPKVELHVHLEGSIRPATLLHLAKKHRVTLPADTVEALHEWYTFTDFSHFIQIYKTFASCLREPEDLEFITREFLAGQAAQNIVYSEVTYTAYSQYKACGMDFGTQLAAINRARQWGEKELGVRLGLIIDISREIPAEEGMITANWAIQGMEQGVVALGLGGFEAGNPPEKFKAAFERARQAGLHSVPHAGEASGPESIWGALRSLGAERIGHGIACVQDPLLMDELARRAIPLEVCPTSNVCLKLATSIENHPMRAMVEAGLVVTLNSDDPPMFNTTLTDEYRKICAAYHWGVSDMERLALNALRSAFLTPGEKQSLERRFREEFGLLKR